jgi:hypothetical protein
MYLLWRIQEFLTGMAALKPFVVVQGAKPPEADEFLQIKVFFSSLD